MSQLDTLKARLAQLNSKTKSSGGNKPKDIWKPKEKHEVRLLPNPEGDQFKELFFHYDIGEARTVLCPKMNFNDECAICDLCDFLKSWKDPKTGEDKPEADRKADFEVFKRIQPKSRFYTPLIERNKESSVPLWWGLAPTQVEAVLKVCCDPDRLESLNIKADDSERQIEVVSNPEKGFDLKVEYKAKSAGAAGKATFASIDIDGKIKPTALAPNNGSIEKIIKAIKPISEVFPKQSSSEVEKILKSFVSSGMKSSDQKPTGGIEYGGKKEQPANTSEKASKVGGRSIDEAFDDLASED